MIDPAVIAHIVTEVRLHAGQHVDETKLTTLIAQGFLKLKHENEKKYLELIHELSEQLEILSREMGRARNRATLNS